MLLGKWTGIGVINYLFWNKIKTEEITFVLKLHSDLTKPKCIELIGGVLIIIYSLRPPSPRMFPTWLCCWKENAFSTPPSTPWATAAAFSFICCCCCSLWNLRSAMCCSLCCLWSFILSWIRRSSFSRSTFLTINQSINQSIKIKDSNSKQTKKFSRKSYKDPVDSDD